MCSSDLTAKAFEQAAKTRLDRKARKAKKKADGGAIKGVPIIDQLKTMPKFNVEMENMYPGMSRFGAGATIPAFGGEISFNAGQTNYESMKPNNRIGVTYKKEFSKGGRTPAWQRAEGKNPEGGLNEKGRRSYHQETGGTLKRPQPEGGKRRDSFCARMKGMKKKLTSAKTAHDPNSRINKSLRAWNC